MTKLSVNINKYALIRNSRGTNSPDIAGIAVDCERFGAQGITVHPRHDERHIKYSDLAPLKKVVTTEFNIEGFPDERFISAVLEIKPEQVTFVPDASNQLTSDHGWDTIGEKDFLIPIIAKLKAVGIRVSLFVDPEETIVAGAANTGADRIELYTGIFAHEFVQNPETAVEPHIRAAHAAEKLNLGVNAGHDLNLDNLRFYKDRIPNLLEVSIGHQLIIDAIYYGLETTIKKYLHELKSEPGAIATG